MIRDVLWLLGVAVIGGSQLAEFGGYVWHRWVAHQGIFRVLPNDFLRRRHVDHHESPDKYPPHRLRRAVYQESCEVTFHFLALVILPIVAGLAGIGFITWQEVGALAAGSILYGTLVQGTLHNWYHLEASTLQKHRLLRHRLVWEAFQWLRRCHDIHHLVPANYFILNPLPDLLFGTLRTRGVNSSERRELFEKFDRGLTSSCKQPLFRR